MTRSSTPDLFDDTPGPTSLSALEDMFESWATAYGSGGRGLSDATSAVMRSMWMAFGAWCNEHRLHPLAVTAAELQAYLKSREGATLAADLSLRYSWRLVTLIGKILQHAKHKTDDDTSHTDRHRAARPRKPMHNDPASDLMAGDHALRRANAQEADPLPVVLTDAEDRALIAFLTASIPRAGKNAGPMHGQTWQQLRNRAAVALHRGAGLTPMEARSLTTDRVHVDPDPRLGAWKVRAPSTGRVSDHDAPLASWARPVLAAWMQHRHQLGIPGDWLFPSTKTGKPWGKTAHFEAVASVLSDAGLVGYNGASYVLRHTFAVKQLARPAAVAAKVAAWLGIDESEMARYRKVLTGPVEIY